jgi:hypothetical protein
MIESNELMKSEGKRVELLDGRKPRQVLEPSCHSTAIGMHDCLVSKDYLFTM